MNIEAFLLKNVEQGETERKIELDRFKAPFVIQAISEEENARLRKGSTLKRRAKGGNFVADLDTDQYVDKLVLRCIKVPDMENAQLQESYGTVGDAAATLKAMLRPGEYATLSQAIQNLNGFDEDVEEIRNEVKN